MRYLSLTVVVILGLAAGRGARLLANDTIFEPLRQKLYGWQSHGRAGRWAYSLVMCPWCLSVWLSAIAVAWWIWLILPTWPGWGEALVGWMATAGAAALFVSADRVADKYLHGDMQAGNEHGE